MSYTALEFNSTLDRVHAFGHGLRLFHVFARFSTSSATILEVRAGTCAVCDEVKDIAFQRFHKARLHHLLVACDLLSVSDAIVLFKCPLMRARPSRASYTRHSTFPGPPAPRCYHVRQWPRRRGHRGARQRASPVPNRGRPTP